MLETFIFKKFQLDKSQRDRFVKYLLTSCEYLSPILKKKNHFFHSKCEKFPELVQPFFFKQPQHNHQIIVEQMKKNQ